MLDLNNDTLNSVEVCVIIVISTFKVKLQLKKLIFSVSTIWQMPANGAYTKVLSVVIPDPVAISTGSGCFVNFVNVG